MQSRRDINSVMSISQSAVQGTQCTGELCTACANDVGNGEGQVKKNKRQDCDEDEEKENEEEEEDDDDDDDE